jgi:hypothetical protein
VQFDGFALRRCGLFGMLAWAASRDLEFGVVFLFCFWVWALRFVSFVLGVAGSIFVRGVMHYFQSYFR